MEDNSGLDLICARNSLSNGLLSETNPTKMSNLGRLKERTNNENNCLQIREIHVYYVNIKRRFAKLGMLL